VKFSALVPTLLLLLVTACIPAGRASAVSGEIVVFAASSLTDAFQDMAYTFEQANPTARLTFNFGASNQLATQLDQGASADVFASADTAQMDSARKSGVLASQDRIFASNRLVLITPKNNPGHVNSVKDLANPGVKLVTAQPGVPIGVYTAQMCDKAAADPHYGSDFKSNVESTPSLRKSTCARWCPKSSSGSPTRPSSTPAMPRHTCTTS
jgi:molybdate transport system substrate-binding protein